jgi:hypothetical protein
MKSIRRMKRNMYMNPKDDRQVRSLCRIFWCVNIEIQTILRLRRKIRSTRRLKTGVSEGRCKKNRGPIVWRLRTSPAKRAYLRRDSNRKG